MPNSAIRVDWPRCPSTNRLWRSSRSRGKVRVYKDKGYVSWLKEAAGCWLLQRPRGFKTIEGPYETTIVVTPGRRDLGNYEKAISDAAQALRIVADDKNCKRFVIEYGEAPLGMRIIFTPLDT